MKNSKLVQKLCKSKKNGTYNSKGRRISPQPKSPKRGYRKVIYGRTDVGVTRSRYNSKTGKIETKFVARCSRRH